MTFALLINNKKKSKTNRIRNSLVSKRNVLKKTLNSLIIRINMYLSLPHEQINLMHFLIVAKFNSQLIPWKI